MNRHEKIAWFNLAVMGFCILLYAVLFLILRGSHSLDFSARIASTVLGLGAFMAFGPMLFRDRLADGGMNEGRRNGIESALFDPGLDERDLMIQRTARMHGFGALWFVFVLGLFGTWMWRFFQFGRGAGSSTLTITLNVFDLPIIIVLSMYLLLLIHSISVITQYRTEGPAEDSDRISLRNCKRSLFFLAYYIVLFPVIGFFMYQGGLWVMVIGLMFGFGIMNLIQFRLGTNPGGAYTDGDMRLLSISRKITGTVFVLLYIAAIIAFIVMLPELGFHPALFVPVTFIAFSTMIMLTTVYPAFRDFLRERRHEKA